MLRSTILPECCYETKKHTMEDVLTAKNKDAALTGRVTNIIEDKQLVAVTLSDDICGYMPFEEATIYPFSYGKSYTQKLPLQITSLHNKNVRVKVTDIVDDTIFLSRKKNMLDSYEHLRKCSLAYCNVTYLTPKIAFCDVGDGIYGAVAIPNICNNRIKNVAEYLHKDDTFWGSILNTDDQNRLNISYKACFPTYNPDNYKEGDSIVGKIGDPVDERCSGYYIAISPQVCGIMDVAHWVPMVKYGDTVECTIAKVTPKGLRLRFGRLL